MFISPLFLRNKKRLGCHVTNIPDECSFPICRHLFVHFPGWCTHLHMDYLCSDHLCDIGARGVGCPLHLCHVSVAVVSQNMAPALPAVQRGSPVTSEGALRSM